MTGVTHLIIEDQDGGIAPAVLEAIFEPFSRAASAKSFEAYGLGLTITRKYSNSMEAASGQTTSAKEASVYTCAGRSTRNNFRSNLLSIFNVQQHQRKPLAAKLRLLALLIRRRDYFNTNKKAPTHCWG